MADDRERLRAAGVARAELALERGRHDEAVGLADTLLAEHPQDIELLLTRARALYAAGRQEECLRTINHLLVVAPEAAYAHELAALALWRQGRSHEARGAASTAVEMTPERADAHRILAIVLADDPASRQRALDAADRAIALDPSTPSGHVVRAEVTWDARRRASRQTRDEALSHLGRALELDPDNKDALALQAAYLLRRGRLASVTELVVRQAIRTSGATASVMATVLLAATRLAFLWYPVFTGVVALLAATPVSPWLVRGVALLPVVVGCWSAVSFVRRTRGSTWAYLRDYARRYPAQAVLGVALVGLWALTIVGGLMPDGGLATGGCCLWVVTLVCFGLSPEQRDST